MRLNEAIDFVKVTRMLDNNSIRHIVVSRFDKNDKKVFAIDHTQFIRIYGDTFCLDIHLNQDYPTIREHLRADNWE